MQLETSRYAESVDATMPAVADRLRQSRHTIIGLALLFVGFLLQLLAAWPKPTASFVLVATPGSAVHPAAVWLSGVGLILGLAAAVVLLRSLFITDEEIARLSELPLGESSYGGITRHLSDAILAERHERHGAAHSSCG